MLQNVDDIRKQSSMRFGSAFYAYSCVFEDMFSRLYDYLCSKNNSSRFQIIKIVSGFRRGGLTILRGFWRWCGWRWWACPCPRACLSWPTEAPDPHRRYPCRLESKTHLLYIHYFSLGSIHLTVTFWLIQGLPPFAVSLSKQLSSHLAAWQS